MIEPNDIIDSIAALDADVISITASRSRIELSRTLGKFHHPNEIVPGVWDMLLSIPPKYSVSQVMGYLKGKSAIQIARTWGGHRCNFVGQHFWARGYWVSTVGQNELAVRLHIQQQGRADQRLDQLGLFRGEGRFERFTLSAATGPTIMSSVTIATIPLLPEVIPT